ncbi:MAG: type II toxin-antitoxin system RelE/ParE family toxin [Cyanobacteria bacterium P01_D01_bin.44]
MNSGYRIEFVKRAAKQIKSLSPQVQKRLKLKIDALSQDPRPSGVIKLSGEENLYRIRVGDYRVIYNIQDDRLLVLVVKVGHRRDVYQ